MNSKKELLESLKNRGFSKQILDAFSKVRREDFVPKNVRSMAYEDTPLPIGHGQTISQPYVIAMMLATLDLKKGQKVLEAGSGSGYVLALMSEILGEKGKVFGLEIIKELAKRSKETLHDYENVRVYNRNGSKGLREEAPFDRIIISAACREVPKTLLNQLKEKGILIAPVGPRFGQNLVAIQREGDSFPVKKEITGFIFVPFVGE